MDDLEKKVAELVRKASETPKADDALKFSQAALNSANAVCTLAYMHQQTKPL